MSGNDTFLGRWSRLKRAENTAEPETARRPEGEEARPAQVRTMDAQPADEDAADIAPEDLPRVEDLTAESDISAFLKKGVPKTLKAAALRRAWSLDPAIRDYVGPQEYAWDFNDPTSMHGFGGGSSMDELARAVRSLSGSEKAADATPPAAAPPTADAVPTPPESAGDVAADSKSDPALQQTAEMADAAETSPQAEEAGKATKTPEQLHPDAGLKPTSGRRHGGAIPT